MISCLKPNAVVKNYLWWWSTERSSCQVKLACPKQEIESEGCCHHTENNNTFDPKFLTVSPVHPPYIKTKLCQRLQLPKLY